MASQKIAICFGTRPEIIKLAPVIRTLQGEYEVSVIHSGQHRELAESLLELFEIYPNHRLDIMQPGQDLFDLTQRLLPALKEVFLKEQPDYVMVQGDTTTAYLSALAAFYLKIPVLHVEAGLRSHNIYAPFPEEVNRKQISVMAHRHFAPTAHNRQNLLDEGVSPGQIHVTGNTVIDALQYIRKTKMYEKQIPEILSQIPEDHKLIVLTAHRRENHGQPLADIFEAAKQILSQYAGVDILFPAHPNPRVQQAVAQAGIQSSRFHKTTPFDYLPFLHILSRADLILTDSGGIQEEASALGKPVLVLRNETERQELIEAGLGKLIGADTEKIVEESLRYLQNQTIFEPKALYGEGDAAQKIKKALLD